MRRFRSLLLFLASVVPLVTGCSKGFVPGSTPPSPPDAPTAEIAPFASDLPEHGSRAPIVNPKLTAAMDKINQSFVNIMTSIGDSSQLPKVASEAQVILKVLPEIQSASQETQYQDFVVEMREHARRVADDASKGDADAALKSTRSMIETCENCHAVYRKEGKLLGGG